MSGNVKYVGLPPVPCVTHLERNKMILGSCYVAAAFVLFRFLYYIDRLCLASLSLAWR